MTDAGYTLSEMLVAMLVIGLASAGSVSATGLLLHMRKSTAVVEIKAAQLRRLNGGLDDLLKGQGSYRFRSDTPSPWTGDSSASQFQCSREQTCSIEVRGDKLTLRSAKDTSIVVLSGLGTLELSYLSAKTGKAENRWPPDKPDRLAGLMIRSPGGLLAFHSFPLSQERRCVFDYTLHDCLPERGAS